MEGRKGLSISLFLLMNLFTAILCELSVKTIPIKPTNIKVGADVTLLCAVNGLSQPDSIVYWRKRVDDESQDISHNGVKQSPYDSIQRYEVTKGEWSKTSRNYTLTITAANANDSGTFECSSEAATSSLRVNIYAPLTGIKINEFNNRQVVHFNDSTEVSLSCYINDTAANTILTASFSDSNGNLEDITQKYFKKETPQQTLTTSENIKTTVSDVVLRNDRFPISKEYNGKRFVCTATNPVDAKETVSAYILMDVSHKPSVVCTKSPEYKLGAIDATISCTVSGNPAVTNNKIYWILPGNGTFKPKLYPGEQAGEYIVKTREGNGKTEVELVINQVHSGHYKAVYVLKAHNIMGASESSVTIKAKGVTKVVLTTSPGSIHTGDGTQGVSMTTVKLPAFFFVLIVGRFLV